MLTSPKFQPQLEAFQRRWRAILRKSLRDYSSGTPASISAWEGFEACRELRQTGHLYVVDPTADRELKFFFNYLTDKLAREVRLYESYSKRVIPTNQGFERALASLPVTLERIRSIETAEPILSLGLSHDLKQCSSIIEKTEKQVRERRKSYWKDALFASPAERGTWSIGYKTFEDAKQGTGYEVLPDEVAEFEKSLEKSLERLDYPNDLIQRTNLDTRFRIRVATILRMYLPAHYAPPTRHDFYLQKFLGPKFGMLVPVSRRTIARLVMLTYLAGQLGSENIDDELIVLEGIRKPVTVVGIEQTLRNAGLK